VLRDLSWFVLASAIAMAVSARLARRAGVHVFGLVERIFYLAHVLWLWAAAGLLVA
jgi:hypothetical protein